jgi:hypothetical protein
MKQLPNTKTTTMSKIHQFINNSSWKICFTEHCQLAKSIKSKSFFHGNHDNNHQGIQRIHSGKNIKNGHIIDKMKTVN